MDSQGNKNRSSLEHKKFAVVMNNTVSKLKFHLYFKMIVSWVRIVNGVDRYVTGSMPTAKEEDTARRNPLLKQDQDRSVSLYSCY